MPNEQPTILSKTMMIRAFADPQFVMQMPEFRMMRAKLSTMKVDLLSPRGCTGCKQRRVEQNLYPEFLTTIRYLQPDGLQRLKKYFGIGKIMMHTVNSASGKVELQIL